MRVLSSTKLEPTAPVERLQAGDGGRLREIRLRALRDAPDAFGSTLEEVEARSLESWDLDVVEVAAFVATEAGRDVGLVRGVRHDTEDDAVIEWARGERFKPNGVTGTLPPPREHIREIQLVRRL